MWRLRRSCSDAREAFPDNAEVTARLFNVYASTGQIELALPVAEGEIERDPDNALHRYNYGSLLLEADRFDDAIVQLEKAVELDTEYGSALFNLGAAYQNKGVDLNDLVNTLDEQIRGGELSEDDQAEAQSKMEEAAAGRDELFAASIDPLERARMLAEDSGEEVTGICSALGQAYARTNNMEAAEEAFSCADADDAEGDDDAEGE